MGALSELHFLRPEWLWLLLPAAALLWLLWRAQSGAHAWRRVLAPHLRAHLLIDNGGSAHWWRPILALGLFWGLGILALAGPAWQRAPSPFLEDRSALVIALKVTPSMLARDVAPSRLARAVQKIRDLLAARQGERTALIAYAGSAHLVMPLTRDARIIEQFAAELDPRIMPREGDAAAEAVTLANARIRQAGTPGSILLIADDVAPHQLTALAEQRDGGGAPVQILAVAAGPEVVPPPDSPPAPALDRAALEQAAAAAGGRLTTVTVDARDIERLDRLLTRQLAGADPEGEAEDDSAWQDGGYLLLPLLAVILLFGFRRGWVLDHG